MKFSAVRFSISVKVFGSENAVGMLATYDNQTSLRCDSLETVDGFLICTRGDDVKAVPLAKIESGDPDIASLLEQLTEPSTPKRGPGRPTNASKALEAQGA